MVDYDPETQFCPLKHPYSRRFVSFLKSGVRPYSFRRFDSVSKQWSVHINKLPMVVTIARRYFDHVDWSSLPEDIQIKLVSRIKSNVEDESFLYRRPDLGPYGVLYLLDMAPMEVVKASYKALVLKHHPDHGGDPEEFRKVQEAYDEIVGSKN